jgi:hypothetical protein
VNLAESSTRRTAGTATLSPVLCLAWCRGALRAGVLILQLCGAGPAFCLRTHVFMCLACVHLICARLSNCVRWADCALILVAGCCVPVPFVCAVCSFNGFTATKELYCCSYNDGSYWGSWGAGSYCIYRRGGSCPSGFNGCSFLADEEVRGALREPCPHIRV